MTISEPLTTVLMRHCDRESYFHGTKYQYLSWKLLENWDHIVPPFKFSNVSLIVIGTHSFTNVIGGEINPGN